jgi:hypothetical protein
MSGGPLVTPKPVCEQCWLKEHAHWEPHSMDNQGNIKMALSGVDVPQKINTGTVETCSVCGKITIAGIFNVEEHKIVFSADPEGSHMYDEEEQHEDEFGGYYGEDRE